MRRRYITPGMWNQIPQHPQQLSDLIKSSYNITFYKSTLTNCCSTVLMSRTALDGFPLGDIEKDFMLDLIKRYSALYFVEILGVCFT